MSKPVGLTHILTELSSLDDLGALLKRSARLKYTCISASKKYLALGSNTGGVYIFRRDTLKYQQVVFADANASPVTCIRLSSTNHHIATAVSTGHVSVFELNIENRSKPERVRQTFDHAGHTVTAMSWDTNGQKLFVGDSAGKLSIVYVPNKKNKALFAVPSEMIAYLEVSIFQMDWWDNRLLVSALTNCFLFDTNRHTFSTIGSKKRDGEFGACIFLEPASLYPVIYCARPGSRIWEVDFDGKVLNTHQFKQLLALPPVPVFNTMSDLYSPSETTVQGGQSVAFNKMISLGSLILTWSSKGLYLFDPINVKVIVWTDSFQGIRDVALYGNDAYLFLDNSSVHRLTLLSIYPLFQLLASRARWSLMSCLLLSSDQINIHTSIIKRVRKDLFEQMVNGLKEHGKTEMVEKLYAMLDDVSDSSVNSVSLGADFMGSTGEEFMGQTTLPSGMVVVSEGFSLDPMVGGDSRMDFDGDEEDDGRMEDRGIEDEEEFADVEEGRFSESNEVIREDEDSFYNSKETVDAEEERFNDSNNNDDDVNHVFVNDNSGDNNVSSLVIENYAQEMTMTNKERIVETVESYGYKNEVLCDDSVEIDMDSVEAIDGGGGGGGSGCGAKMNGIRDKYEYPQQEGEEETERRECTAQGYNHSQENEIKDGGNNNSPTLNSEIESNVSECFHDTTKNFLSHEDDSCQKSENEDEVLNISSKEKIDCDIVNGVGNIRMIDDHPSTSSSPIVETHHHNDNNSSAVIDSDLPLNNISDNKTINHSSSVSDKNGVLEKAAVEQSVSSSNQLVLTHASQLSDISSQDSPTSATQRHVDNTTTTPTPVLKSSSNNKPVLKSSSNDKPVLKSSSNDKPVLKSSSNDKPVLKSSSNDKPVLKSSSNDKPVLKSSSNDKPVLKSSSNDKSKGRFSNVHIKNEDTGVIAEAVKKSKRRRKKTGSIDHSDKDTSDSLRKQILRSASCGDLVQSSLYQHKEKDGDTLSITTISSIEEDHEADHVATTNTNNISNSNEKSLSSLSREKNNGGDVSSPRVLGRKHSYDNVPLTDEKELAHLRKQSIQSLYLESSQGHHGQGQGHVIPPLIDRLAAAKGGERSSSARSTHTTNMNDGLSSSSNSSLTESGEFAALMSQLPSSLSAMKDGFSLKLKKQTKHFIKSFKEKNPLTMKSPTSPLLHSSRPTGKAPVKDLSSLPNHPEELGRQDNLAQATTENRTLSKEEKERLILEKEAVAVVKFELDLLYRKAVQIQTAVKTSNLAMRPGVFKSVLNEWCGELNTVMYRFLVELKDGKEKKEKEEKRKRNKCEERENGEEGEKAKEEVDEGEENDEGVESEDEGCVQGQSYSEPMNDSCTHFVEMDNDARTSTKPDNNSHHNNNCNTPPNTISSPLPGQSSNVSDSNKHSSHSSHPVVEVVDSPSVSFISQILHVNDPFHLTPNQQQAFHDLCTLCFLCGATGNILNTFQLSEDAFSSRINLMKSYLPDHLHASIFSPNNTQENFLMLLAIQRVLAKELDCIKCPCRILTRFKGSSSNKDGLYSSSIDIHLPTCSLHCKDQTKNSYSNENVFSDLNASQNSSEKDDSADKTNSKNYSQSSHDEQSVDDVTKSLTGSQVEDLELAVFLRVYFFLLDYDLIKEDLNKRLSSKFLTWVSLIACCHEKGKSDIVSSLLSDRQSNAAIDYLRSGILLHPSAFIGHLYRLFQFMPSKTAEFCSEVPGIITTQEVVALCLLSDKSPTEPLLKYVRKFIIDLAFFQRSSEFGKLCAIPVVRILLLQAFLPPQEQVGGKDVQSLSTSVISVLPSDWLEEILTRVNSLAEENLILQLCLSSRQWKSCIRLMSKQEDKKPLIDLLVTIGDMDLINKDGYVPQTMEEWKMLLSSFLSTRGTKNKTTTDNDKESYTASYTSSSVGLNETCGSNSNSTSLQGTNHKSNVEKLKEEKFNKSVLLHNKSKNANNEGVKINDDYDDDDDDDVDDDDIIREEENSNIDSAQNLKHSNQENLTQEKEDNVKESNPEYSDSSSMATTTTAPSIKQEVDFMADAPPPKSPMTWESLSKLLVHHLGGATTMQMLSDCLGGGAAAGGVDAEGSLSTPSSLGQIPSLTSSLLQACLSDFSIKAEQTRLCHEMLERLSVYMWAKKPGFLPPSVGHAIKSETSYKEGDGSKALEEDLASHRQLNLLQSIPSGVLMSENLGAHWGQEVNMKQTCQTCQMPLRLIVSHDVPGVVLFPCGDVFHKKCCSDSLCPILH